MPCPEDDDVFDTQDAESQEEAINTMVAHWWAGFPLSHCFWRSTPTIPHIFAKPKDACFPFGCADAASVDGRRGSNVYEVNTWLWSFGRCKPRLGGLSIEQTSARQDAAVSEARHKRAAKPKRVRKTAPG